jgi:peptide/nickel transport system substrate-binding protein
MVSPNPFKACCGSEYEMMFLAYDQLFNFSQDTLEPTEGLAYFPPEESADGKTWTFKIRSGVKWSDGQPVTAKDIAFTFNFVWKMKLAAFNNYIGYPASFEAPDDTTFVWKMERPSTAPLVPPWVPIVPEHIWGKFMSSDAKTIKEFENVPAVGSGPFVLQEWEQGRYWKMEANKSYWMGAPHIDEVIFRVYDTPEALKLALVNGEVDAAEALPPTIFQSLEGIGNITRNVSAPSYWDNLAFNFVGTADPSLQDLDVRLAIAHAINKQAIVDRVMLGFGSVGESVVLPTYSRWYWQPEESEVIGYDPEKAKALLDQAGYKDVNNDGWRERSNGDPWQMQILTISEVTYSVPEGKLINGWLNDIGIHTTLKTVSESKAYDIWLGQDFDMYVWGMGADPDPDFVLSMFTKGQCGSWSDGCWSNSTYEKMYTQQHTVINIDERVELVKKMQQFLYEQSPDVITVYENDLQAYRNDRFTGFVKQPQPVGSIFFAFGPYSYLNIRPVSATSEGDGSGGGISPAVWIVVVVVALLIIVGAVLMMRRRKTAAEEQE